MKIRLHTEDDPKIKLTVPESPSLSLISDYVIPSFPVYEGPYEITPAAEEQVLETAGKTMDGNVRVGAIPNNYGLITWNGSVITVS